MKIVYTNLLPEGLTIAMDNNTIYVGSRTNQNDEGISFKKETVK